MKYRDIESGKIWDEIDLLVEYLDHADEIYQDSGGKTCGEWLRNATCKNGFLEVVDDA